MLTKDDLEQIGKVVEEKIKTSEERVTKKIDDSQKDTIETLSELIHAGHALHEKRIKELEERVDIIHAQ